MIFIYIIFMLNAEIGRDGTFYLIYVIVLFINLTVPLDNTGGCSGRMGVQHLYHIINFVLSIGM